MTAKIWVDDDTEWREPPDHTWAWATSSTMAINMLISHKVLNIPIDVMSLDHDLGGDDTTRPVVMWMIENDFWPDEVRVHSANVVGREWLEGMIDRYKP
jgi:hypothetical protein